MAHALSDPEFADDYDDRDDNEVFCGHLASFIGSRPDEAATTSESSADPPDTASINPLAAPAHNTGATDQPAISEGSLREAIDKYYEERGNKTLCNAMFIVNFVSNLPPRAVLVDSGAQINIENDLTCFVGYLQKSDVTIGLADKL